eukprot:s1180_g6.t1
MKVGSYIKASLYNRTGGCCLSSLSGASSQEASMPGRFPPTWGEEAASATAPPGHLEGRRGVARLKGFAEEQQQ